MMKCDHMDHMVLSQNNVIILYKSQNDSLEVYPILRHTHIPLYIYCLRTPHHPPPDRGHGVMESNEDSESLISQALRGVETS